MARRLPDLIDDLAVIQGETYQQINIVEDGDYTAWAYRGQIRDNTIEKGGIILASFSFGTSVYASSKTTTSVILSATQTSALDATIYQGTSSGKTLKIGNAYVYDIERSLGGVVHKKAPAFIQVIGEACSDA